jgi:hypothetical protein
MNPETDCKIEIRDLTMAYGSFVVMRDINAKIKRGGNYSPVSAYSCPERANWMATRGL